MENRNCETVLIVRDEEKFENQACGLQPRSRKYLENTDREMVDKVVISQDLQLSVIVQRWMLTQFQEDFSKFSLTE